MTLQQTVHEDFASLDAMREAWDRLALEAGSPVYTSYDWARLWWEFYGRGLELRVITFQSAGELVGVVPAFIETRGLGPLRFRVARLIAASIPPHVVTLPVRDPWLRSVVELTLHRLFNVDNCDCVSLGPASAAWSGRGEVLAAARGLPELAGRIEAAAHDVHAVIALPPDYDAYISSLSKSERKRRREYELRHFDKECDTKVEVIRDGKLLADEFDRFAEQHVKQWQAEGRPGHFAAWPRGREFHRLLVQAQGRLGRVRFIRILVDGKTVSSQYVYAFGDTYYAELLARDMGPEWHRFGLGRISVAAAIRVAIEEGVRRYDAGTGHYDFKVRLGAREFEVSPLRVIRNDPSSLRKARFHGWLRSGVALTYHKLWYRRIQRRFPVHWQRPHSRRLLRFDF
jgi:CelD/BcsL family acetyltransferase involved in cellulose biosynthesis